MSATIKELKATLAELGPLERAELVDYLLHSLPSTAIEEDLAPRKTLFDAFIRGVGSVLEFFPPAERLDRWRLAPDVPIDEWPDTVRSLLAGLREDDNQPGAGS